MANRTSSRPHVMIKCELSADKTPWRIVIRNGSVRINIKNINMKKKAISLSITNFWYIEFVIDSDMTRYKKTHKVIVSNYRYIKIIFSMSNIPYRIWYTEIIYIYRYSRYTDFFLIPILYRNFQYTIKFSIYSIFSER